MTSLRSLAALLLFASVAHAVPPPAAHDDAPLRAVQFADANEGWACGDDGTVWHTIDGGSSWDRQKTGTRASLRGLHFVTPYTGWVVGRTETPDGSCGVLLKTADGGQTWAEVAANTLPGLSGVRFADDKTGVAFGDGSPQFPGGAFLTTDGGGTWRPLAGAMCSGWLSAAFADPTTALLVGRWGRVAAVRNGEMVPLDLGIPGGRAARGVAVSGKKAMVVGDGGMVLVSADWQAGGWTPVELPLPPAARAVCDFHAIGCVGECVWVAGRPGSVVFVSPDFGKTWEVRKTPTTQPVHAIAMTSATHGRLVGSFGTILGTADGGATWKLLKSGGQRAAVLFASATPAGLPVGAFPQLGRLDGYHLTAACVTCPDPANADPRRAGDERLATAVRSAGGTSAAMGWAFPLPAHCDGLPADKLMAVWDAAHGGKAGEHLLRELVLTIRTLRPDVIVAGETAKPAGQIVQAGCKEAFKLAADPQAFPEQLAALGLQPHAAMKLYVVNGENEARHVTVGVAKFVKELADTPRSQSAESARLLGHVVPTDWYGFTQVESRAANVESANLTDGCDLARGGTARRAADPRSFTPEYVAIREKGTAARAVFEAAARKAFDAPDADHDAVLKDIGDRLAAVPEDMAADALVTLAAECLRAGKPTVAREWYALAADKYPTFPASAEAFRFLATFHGSSEVIRRIERGELRAVRAKEFVTLPPVANPAPEIELAAYAEPLVTKTRVKFRSGEAEQGWLTAGPDAESRLYAISPQLARSPVTQLAYSAARTRAGLTSDAETGLTRYFRAAALPKLQPGLNPWQDAVAAELHRMNRHAMPNCPKPVAGCARTANRPHLDGKLDDECWKTAPLMVGARAADAAPLDEFATEAWFAFDDAFVYIAVSCKHPEAEPAKAEPRARDADLSGQDRIDLLLDLDRDYQSYYRLRIDRRGQLAEDCSGDPTWNPRWFVSHAATPTGWTAEVAVPISELTVRPPAASHAWAMNVVRVLPGRGVRAWSQPADATPRPEGMGLLEFRTK